MIFFFRRLLINTGKVIPFILAAVVCFGYGELWSAIQEKRMVVMTSSVSFYYTPCSDFIGQIVYIDMFDVLLLYILAVALQFCWRNMLAIHYLALNLAVRAALEASIIDERLTVPLCTVMFALGLYCAFSSIYAYILGIVRKHYTFIKTNEK